jgi:hypothetical protein
MATSGPALVDEVADVLRPTAQWNAPGVHIEDLIPEVIAHGDSGPGRVWDTEQPLWLPDLTDPAYATTPEGHTLGLAIAERGLQAGLLVPVRAGGTVLGVLASLCATSDTTRSCSPDYVTTSPGSSASSSAANAGRSSPCNWRTPKTTSSPSSATNSAPH